MTNKKLPGCFPFNRNTNPILVLTTPVQANAYPWIAALLRDEDIDAQYLNSRCSAVLVSSSPTITSNIHQTLLFSNFYLLSPQIGNRFALTAAHCLYDEDEEDENRRELLPASSFSIMLGLHDRRKPMEPNR